MLFILKRQELILERLLSILEEDQRLERLLLHGREVLLSLVVVHVEVAVECFTDFDQEDLLTPHPEGLLEYRNCLIVHNSVESFVQSCLVPR